MHGLDRVKGCHLHDALIGTKDFAYQNHCLFLTFTSCVTDAESKDKRASDSEFLHSASCMKRLEDALLENRPCPDINVCILYSGERRSSTEEPYTKHILKSKNKLIHT